MKTIQNSAAVVFIVAVAVLCVIAVLGIWQFLASDVITKSFETMGLLAFAAVVVLLAGRFIEGKSSAEGIMPVAPNPAWKLTRQATLVVLIVAVALLALVGVLAIWNVINDPSIVSKVLGSLATIAFSAFVIVVTCLDREESPLLRKRVGGSIGAIVAVLIVVWIIFAVFNSFR